MPKLALPLLIVALACVLGGCAHKPKSSARLYDGDGPSLRYNDKPETAGGRIYTH